MIYGDIRELNPRHRTYSEPKENEINLKIKVDSTELDLVLAALKEVSLELSKINSVLDSMVIQCARGQVATAMHVTLP